MFRYKLPLYKNIVNVFYDDDEYDDRDDDRDDYYDGGGGDDVFLILNVSLFYWLKQKRSLPHCRLCHHRYFSCVCLYDV